MIAVPWCRPGAIKCNQVQTETAPVQSAVATHMPPGCIATCVQTDADACSAPMRRADATSKKSTAPLADPAARTLPASR